MLSSRITPYISSRIVVIFLMAGTSFSPVQHCLQAFPESFFSLFPKCFVGRVQVFLSDPFTVGFGHFRIKSVQQVLDVVLQDLPFYEESGGGLTLSGGEFLMQPTFSKNLLMAAKEEGLHTCCETTGYAKPEIFRKIAEHLDCLLFDMKHWGAQRHLQATGVTNELPLLNMKHAISAGKDVLPRIPVIPGFNDSLTDAEGLSGRLHEVGADRCQLLPFHQFGENKYALLGADYSYRDKPALHKEDLESYCRVFLDHGIQAFF